MESDLKPPLPRFRLSVKIDASELSDLWHALNNLLTQWVWMQEDDPSATPFHDGLYCGLWGGGGSSGNYEAVDRGGPDKEEYNRLLEKWRAKTMQAEQAGG